MGVKCMGKVRSVKFQWVVSYVALMLIPIIIFLSILTVTVQTVKQNILYEESLILNAVKKDLDSCFYSMKMTYLKLEYDSNLRKLMSNSIETRERQIQTANTILSRTYETYMFDGLRQKIYIALPELDLALCSDSGIADVDTVTKISFGDTDYSQLEAMTAGEKSGNFFALDVLDNGGTEKVLAYIGRLSMTQGTRSKGLAVVWIDLDDFLEGNDILKTLENREIALLNQEGEAIYSTFDELGIDMSKKEQGSYEENGAIVSFVSLENSDWCGVISTPKALAMKQFMGLQLLTVLGIILCLVCGVSGIVILLRRNYKPVQKLMERLSAKRNRRVSEDSDINAYDVLNKSISQILDEAEQMQKNVDKLNKTLREIYLSRLLSGRYSPELLETAEETPDFLSKDFVVVLLETENEEELFPDTDILPENRRQMAQVIITNIMEELINEHHRGYVIPYKEHFAMIVSLSSDDAALPGIVRKGTAAIYQHFQLIIRAAVGGMHKSYYGICESCREAEGVLEYGDFSENADVMQFCDLRPVSSYSYPPSAEAQLTSAVTSRDFQTIRETLNEIFEQNLTDKGHTKYIHKCLLLRIVATLLRSAGENVQYTSEAVRLINDGADWRQTEERLLAFAEKICNDSMRPKSSALSLAERVCAYLDENYSDNNVSIQLLGDYFSMSPYYLSKMFKNELGISFGDYLRRVRVEHAKALLEREESILLKDVAVQVGFSDARALKRAFLQEVGILPSEYLGRKKSK